MLYAPLGRRASGKRFRPIDCVAIGVQHTEAVAVRYADHSAARRVES
jgi:hypothetical protein